MGLSINTIITLDNQEKYIVLNETMYLGQKYFLTMGIDDKQNPKNEDAKIFVEEVEGLDVYVRQISDSDLIVKLTKLLKEQI